MPRNTPRTVSEDIRFSLNEFADALDTGKGYREGEKKIQINPEDNFVLLRDYGKFKKGMIIKPMDAPFYLMPSSNMTFNAMENSKGIKDIVSYKALDPVWHLKKDLATNISILEEKLNYFKEILNFMEEANKEYVTRREWKMRNAWEILQELNKENIDDKEKYKRILAMLGEVESERK